MESRFLLAVITNGTTKFLEAIPENVAKNLLIQIENCSILKHSITLELTGWGETAHVHLFLDVNPLVGYVLLVHCPQMTGHVSS